LEGENLNLPLSVLYVKVFFKVFDLKPLKC